MRKFNSIKTDFWRKLPRDLKCDARALLIYLLTNDAVTITGMQAFSPDRIEADLGISEGTTTQAFKQLRKAGLVILEDGYIWTPLRWENEQTRAGKVLTLIESEIEIMPKGIRYAFQKVLSGSTDRVCDTVSDTHDASLPDDMEMDRDMERDMDNTILPALKPAADNNKPPPGKEKKYIPIEERTANTPGAKLVKFWHVKYFEIHGSKYSGNIKKMQGQVANLLKRNSMEDLCLAMGYLLLDHEHDMYHKHSFDHFVKKASDYIIEAKKAGYEYER